LPSAPATSPCRHHAALSCARAEVSCAGEPAEPDKARVLTQPRAESLVSGTGHLPPLKWPEERQAALRFAVSACMSVRESQHHSAHPLPMSPSLSFLSRPSHCVQDRTRPVPKAFLIPNGTRIHFLIILPDSTVRLHYLRQERQRLPPSPHFLVSRFAFLVLPPRHASPVQDSGAAVPVLALLRE
jgi:hypothetical protein